MPGNMASTGCEEKDEVAASMPGYLLAHLWGPKSLESLQGDPCFPLGAATTEPGPTQTLLNLSQF